MPLRLCLFDFVFSMHRRVIELADQLDAGRRADSTYDCMPDDRQTAVSPSAMEATGKPLSFRDRLRSLRDSPRDLSRLLAYARPYRARLAVALVSLFIAS